MGTTLGRTFALYQQASKGCYAREHEVLQVRRLWCKVLLGIRKVEVKPTKYHLHIADVLWENIPSCTNPDPQVQCQNITSFCATFICFCTTPARITPRVSYPGKECMHIAVMFHGPSSGKNVTSVFYIFSPSIYTGALRATQTN